MSKIVKLPQQVAELIAAGEVVERPSSVVKELVENSIDAGASQITVEIENGGITYIRITDNGCGIAADDVKTAFLRNATSKISKAEDLFEINTLGFRGEALAAAAAVSRIDMLTKTADASEGTHIHVEGGAIGEPREAGCPNGTTIVVRDLFFNTPARLKFMKRDATEAGYVASAVAHAALSRPDVSFRFIKNGKQELLTPGSGDLRAALYAVYGREYANSLIETSGQTDGVSVCGFVTKPECSRANRTMQDFFVNGRHIFSKTMCAALEQAYRNRIMVGRYPCCALNITASPLMFDVNVHPAKTEIKFSDERRIFDAVYRAVKSALDGDLTRTDARIEKAAADDDASLSVTGVQGGERIENDSRGAALRTSEQEEKESERSAPPQNAAERSLHDGSRAETNGQSAERNGSCNVAAAFGMAEKNDRIEIGGARAMPVGRRGIFISGPDEDRSALVKDGAQIGLCADGQHGAKRYAGRIEAETAQSGRQTARQDGNSANWRETEQGGEYGAEQSTENSENEGVFEQHARSTDPIERDKDNQDREQRSMTGDQADLLAVQQAEQERGLLAQTPDYKVIGELFKTYIVVEQGDSAVIIDKHAAHERIIFNSMSKDGDIPMQQLIEPYILSLSPEEASLLVQNADLLEKIGFCAEEFGIGALAVRQIPVYMEESDIAPVLTELALKLKNGRLSRPQLLTAIYEKMACTAAIKANSFTDAAERDAFAARIMSSPEVKYCPHGRPVAVTLSKRELEKMFKRV